MAYRESGFTFCEAWDNDELSTAARHFDCRDVSAVTQDTEGERETLTAYCGTGT